MKTAFIGRAPDTHCYKKLVNILRTLFTNEVSIDLLNYLHAF